MKNPVRGQTYTFDQIVNELNLRDEPFLRFRAHDLVQVIQVTSESEDVMLTPEWADSRWTFELETSELIPLFRFADDNEVKIDQLVDMYDDLSPYREYENTKYVVPKGTEPEHQYVKVEVGGEPRVAYFTVQPPYTLDNTFALPVFKNGERVRA